MKLLACILFFALPWALAAQPLTAETIVRRADSVMRGQTMQTEIIINTIRPAWKRSMELKAWAKGTDFSMILITSPARDKGITFLKRKKEVWNWHPSLERIIKLPPSMMSQSWMGTDFTNDDLVKESSIVNDYQHTLLGDTLLQDRKCYIVQMVPKPQTAVVWGKIIACIDQQHYMELHSRFYDEEGVLINVMNGYEPKLMDGRLIPTHIEMIPMDKKNQKTEMIYKSVRYNQPIDDNFFTTEKMKSIR
ncbi:outer membrane lipoprotein-sorting protein [Rhodoflexus caldus]|uniref:outer membrane lipoprotein-sorting protein n=1 Tax=Rhodoflexus caldus TaxID=2891236 RepID=UPI00202A8A1D|nr:outer membrane lipoprotein-sorting protein [Rhodoflexus caldus]